MDRFGKAKERERNYSFSDDELRKAAVKLIYAGTDTGLPEREHVFSTRFQAKMEALIRKGRRAHSFRRFARSAAAVLLMALMVAGIWLAFDGEARAEFLRWIRNEYENGIVYKFFARREEKMLPDVEVGWLPEGYAESVRKISSDHGYILFIDDNGERLVLYYRYMYSATSYSITCDNNVVREEVFVNGEIADFYLDKGKESQNLLFWSNDNWGIKFNLDAALDKEVMIKIAENIRIIE